MHGTAHDPRALVAQLGKRARAASIQLARISTPRKSEGVLAAAAALRDASDLILAANAKDLDAGAAKGLTLAMIDRLRLTAERIESIAKGLETVAYLRDPVGMVIDETIRPNGLKLTRLRVPLGVIGIIYESRPNVTADAAALCLKSGNAVILRGGSEARESNQAIHAAMVGAISRIGLPEDSIQFVDTPDRAVVGAMLEAAGLIDMIIPRGGKSLVSRVQADARVPVLAHLDGLCHTYIDGAADPDKAREIAVNAKMRRTGICGAMETLLIDRAYPHPRSVLAALVDAGCELRGTPEIVALEPRAKLAGDADWDTEYLDSICAVSLVDGLDAAVAHIGQHGSSHTDAIITEDLMAAETFLAVVDSAIVMHNASTQFADGGEFGLGAEIGIATGRLHARGPVALEGLTTYKWVVRGTGQARP
ncbi:MAG: glutamate-5-semialdehyde dehydrogenase [Pseudomonadota bacterium]